MEKGKIVFLSAFLLVFSLFKETNAQLTLELSSNNYYDDNIYNNYYKVDDFVNGITFGSGYDINSSNNNFQKYSEIQLHE
jgi:hypothetical protein